jgi:hypothetical protein
MSWLPLHTFVEQNTVLAVFLAILSGTVLGRLHLGGRSEVRKAVANAEQGMYYGNADARPRVGPGDARLLGCDAPRV